MQMYIELDEEEVAKLLHEAIRHRWPNITPRQTFFKLTLDDLITARVELITPEQVQEGEVWR